MMLKMPFAGKAMETGTGRRAMLYDDYLAAQPRYLTHKTSPLYDSKALKAQFKNTYPESMRYTQAYYDKQRAINQFTDSYVQGRGRSRLGAGLFGFYTGYMSSIGYDAGSNYAYAPMMAQMDSSSMSSGAGQDLYINNAYVESNNFKDLFYSADELGGI